MYKQKENWHTLQCGGICTPAQTIYKCLNSIQHSKEIDISEELKNIKNVAYKFATTFKQVFVRKNNIEILEIKPCFVTIVVEGFEKNENEQILENGQDIIEILQFTDSTEEQVINCYDFTYPTLHSHLQTENYYLNAV